MDSHILQILKQKHSIILPFAPLSKASSISLSSKTKPAFLIKLTEKLNDLHFLRLLLILFKNDFTRIEEREKYMTYYKKYKGII